MLELEHTMSDIISSECAHVDQVIVENCNNIYWMLHLIGKCFSTLNREIKL